MEKIKLSLWDTFAFISASIIIHVIFAVNELYVLHSNQVDSFSIPQLDGYIWLTILITYFLLSGMIIEPIINVVHDYVYKLLPKKIYYDASEMNDLSLFIKNDVLQRTGFEIKGSPYHFVKDYLIDNGHSSLFLVFLSKYGFYRSCEVIFLLVAARNLFSPSYISLFFSLIYIIVALICYKRTNQFYDYQGPTLYRTYIMINKK